MNTKHTTIYEPGTVPGTRATHRLVDAEEVLKAGDQFATTPGNWVAIPSRWYGKQAGQLFAMPGGEAINDRSPVLMRAAVRRQLEVNTRQRESLARRFARLFRLPLKMPSKQPAIPCVLVLILCALAMLFLSGCATSPYGQPSPYHPATRYDTPAQTFWR